MLPGLIQFHPVHVEEALVVVHPHFGHPGRVNAMTVLWNEVRMEVSEDVTHVTARDVLHGASATPGTER